MSDCVQVNLRITTNSNQGGRKYMEDTYAIALQRLNPSDKESPISLAYFGIFDGHGGKEAAEFARQHLCEHILERDEFWSETSNDVEILSAIRQGFLSCHQEMWNHLDQWSKTSSGLPSTSGCTASVIFVRGNKLYIGHVGDSSIVIGEGDSLYKAWRANRITRDHKPEDPGELQRIRASGGDVLCKAGVHRVVWNRQKLGPSRTTTVEYDQIPFLAVSRALGDLWSFNEQTNLYSVSPEPELTVIEIDPEKHRCLILASDGLWNMITPEAAVEIVRNCDVKTEEMILQTEDDDDRPFRNPSHELVQKALVSWRHRSLRADNITCITVMLDPPGPPFSDCILTKKKQLNSCSLSPSDSMSGTPQRPKLTNQHILLPLPNGSAPLRTPKRPASEEPIDSSQDETPRRKQIKTKENDEEISQQDEEEYLPLTEQTAKMSTMDDEQIKTKAPLTTHRRRRSRFRFSFTHQNTELDEVPSPSKRKSRLARTLSASIINEHQDQTKGSSRRRKSYSSTGLANELNLQLDQKSLKNKSSLATRVKRAFFRPHRAAL